MYAAVLPGLMESQVIASQIRRDAAHHDTGARPTPGPHIGFICLNPFIIPQKRPAWRASIEGAFPAR
jgi:hypothetical protein